MIEVYPDVYVGSDQDAELLLSYPTDEWYVLHCAKERWHRQFVDYKGRGAPKDHPEYLYARRGNRMALNMVDAPKPEFFSPEMIKAGLDFLEEGHSKCKKLLIHCNEGCSRAPSMSMLFVAKRIKGQPQTFEQAENSLRERYPAYNPGVGVRKHMMQCWGEY